MRTHVGQYRIEAPLGRGGMGVVYRGVHEHLGRPVAIKALAPELTQQPEFKERFFSEAKTQARMQHPNIVGVYDLLEDGGEFFIVMEFVAGEGLDERLKAQAGRPADLQESLGIFCQVLAALDYAHSEGVIHRDIKPSNVMITANGRVKITDFGIALLIGDKRLTASQSAIGTPTYMSPEQILRPRSVDHRADIYSAAVVFYEMLAGKPPFDDETEYGIKKLHVEAPLPDLAALCPGLPFGVVHVVSIALNKNPDDRYPSAGAFLRALQEAAPGAVPSGATPLPTPIYRPTTLDSTWTGAGTAAQPAPPPLPPAVAGKGSSGLLQGKNRWIALAAAVLILLIGSGIAAFILTSGSGDGQQVADAGTQTVAPPSSPNGAAVTPTQSLAPGTAVASPDTNPGLVTAPLGASSVPTEQTRLVPVEDTKLRRGVEPQTVPADAASLSRKKKEAVAETPAPPPPAATPPPVVAQPAPEPPPAAPAPAEPQEEEPAGSSSSIDRFNQMNDIIVSIEQLSGQAVEAYEQEGRDDALTTQLESFSEAAAGLRKEFRKATGTGLAGLKANVKGILRRNKGGQEADTKILEVKAQDLIRRGGDVDRVISSNPPGAVTLEYWKEVRRKLKKLDGYV